MNVLIPSPLQSYTGGARLVSAAGSTLDEVLWDLDRRYPGIRFRVVDEQDRIRGNIVMFVEGERTRDLDCCTVRATEVVLLHALSGG